MSLFSEAWVLEKGEESGFKVWMQHNSLGPRSKVFSLWEPRFSNCQDRERMSSMTCGSQGSQEK